MSDITLYMLDILGKMWDDPDSLGVMYLTLFCLDKIEGWGVVLASQVNRE